MVEKKEWKPKNMDAVEGRGKTGKDPVGTALWVGLRGLDPLLQRSILLAAPLAQLASKLGFAAPASAPSGEVVMGLDGSSLRLTPFQTVLFAMSVGSAVKQIYWHLATSNEPLYAKGALLIAAFNTVNNGLNTLLFGLAASNPTWSPWNIYAGIAMYTIGIILEPLAETQRQIFKSKKENQGKLYSGGLFSLARHINYTGYFLWRGGFALAAGGPIFGAFIALWFASDFATRAIPTLDDYCQHKYGAQWEKVKEKTTYKLVPGLY